MPPIAAAIGGILLTGNERGFIMMTVDEFDAPRLPKAPTAHCITMISGASVQFLVYAVPAFHLAKEQFPFYIALVNNRDNTLITSFGVKEYKWALKRAYEMCLANLEGR